MTTLLETYEKEETKALGTLLKRVILAELAAQIDETYGTRGILLFANDRIQIVKADFQGLALLSSKTEFEVLQEFDRITDLVDWLECKNG